MSEELKNNGNADANLTNVETKADNAEVKQEVKEQGNQALTLEEVKKMIQSETDRVRTEYVKKLKEREQELEELKKQSMTEQEKIQYELQKKEQELKEREQKIQELAMHTETINKLKEHGLDLDFADYVKGKDVEKFKSLMQTKIDEAVQRAINERLKTNTAIPKTTGEAGEAFFTKEQVDNMTQEDIAKNLEAIKKSMQKW